MNAIHTHTHIRNSRSFQTRYGEIEREGRKKGGNADREKLALKEFLDLSGWSAPTFSREPRDESQAFAVARAVVIIAKKLIKNPAGMRPFAFTPYRLPSSLRKGGSFVVRTAPLSSHTRGRFDPSSRVAFLISFLHDSFIVFK